MSRRPSRRGRGDKKPRVKLPPPATVDIETLESHGDGAGLAPDGKRVYVPCTLPGDRVQIEFVASRGDGYAARATGFIEQVPRRGVDCSVFETCGGCQLQHVPVAYYQAWKSDTVKTALGRQGIEPDIRPLISAPLSSRRRTTIKVKRTSGGVIIGFNAAQSDQIVDIDHCPRLIDPLNRLITPIRNLSEKLLPTNGAARFAITNTGANALDVVIETDVELDLERLEILSEFAHAQQISRITRKSSDNLLEPVIELKPINVNLAEVRVPLPPDSFLQPSSEGERILTELVTRATSGAVHVIDLYAGVGTFSVPLAKTAKSVLAIDGASHQIGALQSAINQDVKLANIKTETRDLQRNALVPSELNHADAIIFDPPRAGAKEQSFEIAQSSVPLVIAVSCNPATMARDLRCLIDGGYEIEYITPVDQFPMSFHVEAVAVLKRVQ